MDCSALINGNVYPVRVSVNDVKGSTVDYSFRMESKPAGGGSGGPSSSPSAEPSSEPSSEPSPEPSSSPSEEPRTTGGKVARVNVELAIMNKVKDQTGDTVIVDCPADLDAKVGTKMTCDYSTLDKKGKVEVEVTSIDSDGKVNFRFREA